MGKRSLVPKRGRGEPPEEVAAIRAELEKVLNSQDRQGRVISNARVGVYAFYDYDAEPIYVGQTVEKLRTRIRRHLTNQRTDAVAMSVLDPFEVAEVEMWPFWDLEQSASLEIEPTLDSAEYTVFQNLVLQSVFHAVLNEAPIKEAARIKLPQSHRFRIVPEPVFSRRKHLDLRVARRANTIARLVQVIAERSVQLGLRATLLTQARRLEHLTHQRLQEVQPSPDG